ncbi:MAG TPA: enoyl-CoA hydratase-related protein [Myxococcota bacterium]|nr:enoyl-CoA hydratase-related protein [Myxococcota bacterium]
MVRETVTLERGEDGVLVLTLSRPRQKNAFSEVMWREARDALAEAQQDDAVRAVLVTGAGDAFSAGQDLGQMAAPPPGEPPGFPSFMDRLTAFDKPLFAAVNGVGVGIGLTLLLHCDVVWIAEGARLRAPFVTLGVVPEAASSYLLPLQLGHQRAAELLYTAEWIDAGRAVELGLASRALPRERLLPEMRAFAARVAAQPLGSLRWTKRLLLAVRADGIRAARAREDAGFAARVGSPENQEALRAFFEKRPADFRGVSPRDRD